MKKIKSILLLSVLGIMFSVPVYAVNYSISTSTYTLAYRDYPSELAASSSAAVVGGAKVAACVGVDGAGGECGDFYVGRASYYKMFFQTSTYNRHKHFTMDEDGNIGNMK